jgi:fumarate hydratase subunit beta
VTVEVLDDGRKRIEAPLSDEDVRELKIGDVVLVRGTVYAARDAAHKRMVEMLDRVRSSPSRSPARSSTTWGPRRSVPGT